MIIHNQHSSTDKTWFDLAVAFDGVTLTIPAGSAWIHGTEYALPALSYAPGATAFYVFLEAPTPTTLDYVVTVFTDEDTRELGTPLKPQVGLPVVVWRDVTGGEIHVLRSIT